MGLRMVTGAWDARDGYEVSGARLELRDLICRGLLAVSCLEMPGEYILSNLSTKWLICSSISPCIYDAMFKQERSWLEPQLSRRACAGILTHGGVRWARNAGSLSARCTISFLTLFS